MSEKDYSAKFVVRHMPDEHTPVDAFDPAANRDEAGLIEYGFEVEGAYFTLGTIKAPFFFDRLRLAEAAKKDKKPDESK